MLQQHELRINRLVCMKNQYCIKLVHYEIQWTKIYDAQQTWNIIYVLNLNQHSNHQYSHEHHNLTIPCKLMSINSKLVFGKWKQQLSPLVLYPCECYRKATEYRSIPIFQQIGEVFQMEKHLKIYKEMHHYRESI